MIRMVLFALGFVLETLALVRAACAGTFEEGAYWFSMATYVAAVAIASRQIANGHSYFTKKDGR